MTTSNSIHGDKDLMRERARQERALQAQQLQDPDSGVPAPLFGEPRKRTPSAEDSTHQQIKKVLGEYDQVQPYVTHLVGIGKVPVTPLPGKITTTGLGFIYPQNATARPMLNGATFKSTSKTSAKEVTKHIGQQDNASDKNIQEKHRTSGKQRLSESGRSVDQNSSSSHGKGDLSEKGSTHSHKSTSGSSHSHKSHSSKSGKHSVKIKDTNSVKTKPDQVKHVVPPTGGASNEKPLSETVPTSVSSSASKTAIQDGGISKQKSPTPKPLSKPSPHQLVGSMKNLPNGVMVNGHLKKANHSRSGNVLNILMPSETENKPFSEDPKELADILKEMTCLEAPLTAIHSPRKEEKFFSSNSIANTKPFRKPSNLVNNVDDLPRKENKTKTEDGFESSADENDSESEDEAVQETSKRTGGKHVAGRARKSPSRTSCMSSASSSSASGSSSESSSEDESSSEEEKDEPEETIPTSPPAAPPPKSTSASQAETQSTGWWCLKNFAPPRQSSSKPSEDRGMRISFSTDDEVEVIKPERSKHKSEHKRKHSSKVNNNKSPVRCKLNSSSKDVKSSKSPSWKLARKSAATEVTHETTSQSAIISKGHDMSGSSNSNKSTSGDKGRNGESTAGNTPTGRWKKCKAITPDIVSDAVSSELEIDVVTVSPEKAALNLLKTATATEKSHLSQRLEFNTQDKVVVSNTEERKKESKSESSSRKSKDNDSGSAKTKTGSCDKNKTVVDNEGKIKKSGHVRLDKDLEHIMDSVISPHLHLLSPIPNEPEKCPSLPASWLHPTTTREIGKLSLVVKLNLALIDSLPRSDNGDNNADDNFKKENISCCLPEKQVTNVILDIKNGVEEPALSELTPENVTVKKDPDKISSTPDKSVFNKDAIVKSEPDTESGDAPGKEDTPTSVVDSKSLIRNQLFGEATPPDITKNIPKRKLEMDRQDDTKRHKSKSSTPTKRKPEPEKEKVKAEDEKESTHRKHTKRLSERRGSGGSSSSQKGGSKRNHTREEKGTAHASKTNNSEEPLQNGVANHRADSRLSANDPIGGKSENEVLHNRIQPPEEKVENPAVHLSAAQKLKHQADGMTDRLAKLSTYTEAVLSFILYGYALEKDHLSDASKMYRETHDLIIYISKLRANQPESSLSISDKILSVLSLRIQSLLCLKLFKLRKSDALKLKRIVDDHNKSNKPVAHHAPSPHQTGLTNHSTGAPSPMSPTPSPSGSIGSQGSCDLAVPKMTNGNLPSAVPKAPPGTINIPMRIHSVTQKYLKDVGFLVVCHDLWEQADTASLECNDFFTNLDDVCGPLSLHTNVPDLVRFIRKGLATLSSNT